MENGLKLRERGNDLNFEGKSGRKGFENCEKRVNGIIHVVERNEGKEEAKE